MYEKYLNCTAMQQMKLNELTKLLQIYPSIESALNSFWRRDIFNLIQVTDK